MLLPLGLSIRCTEGHREVSGYCDQELAADEEGPGICWGQSYSLGSPSPSPWETRELPCPLLSPCGSAPHIDCGASHGADRREALGVAPHPGLSSSCLKS